MSEVTGSTESGSSETSVENTGVENTESVENNEGAESPEGVESKAPTPASLKKKLKLMVDGEEFEDEIDFNDEEGLKKRLQLAHAAKKRMGEAKEAQSKAMDIVKQFEDDPASVFKRLGAKGRAAAEKYLLEQIQEEMLSPEEKNQRSEKSELEELRAEKARAKEEAEKAERTAIENKYAQDFQKTIIDSLEKSGLPKTPELVKRMAGIMKKNLDLGLELTADDLVQEVKGDEMARLKAIIRDADGNQLVSMFGEEIANKIRKADLQKLQEKRGQLFNSSKVNQKETTSERSDKRPLTTDEWKAEIERRAKE